jgi:quercetin dioxygenase-like cupin family protein
MRKHVSTNDARATPVHAVAPREGDALWFNGAHQTIKVPGAWSDDAFSLVEVTSTEGRATGLHTDPSHETFYVLEGVLRFHVDGEEQLAEAGQTVAIRRGVPHAFMIESPTARFLVLNTPGGHDRFFRAGGEPALSRDFSSAPQPDHARTAAAARDHGVALLGPPPFEGVRARSG